MAQSITISDVACVNLRGFCVSTRLTNRVHGVVLTIYFPDAQEMCTKHCILIHDVDSTLQCLEWNLC